MRLAIDGGAPAISGLFRKFSSIGEEEIAAACAAIRSGPLSGYLAGSEHGGLRVEALEHEWATAVGAKHAIAVNSGTSAILAACVACEVRRGDDVIVSPYTMSASGAAPAFLGANVRFGDIEDKTFSLVEIPPPIRRIKASVIVNLFGHPAYLASARKVADQMGHYLIEDNAQSPFATEDGKHAGTIGHVGCFSLNIHKSIQAGEGGVCTTNDDDLAHRIRMFRNHGEAAGGEIGMNLRMTETTAAIALAQLAKREQIIASRIELADELTHMVVNIPGVRPPIVREGCRHVYYLWSLLLDHDRDWFVRACQVEGIPLRAGYVTPLYKLPAFKQNAHCPVTENVERRIALFEICAYSPSANHMRQMREAFAKVGDAYAKRAMVEPVGV